MNKQSGSASSLLLSRNLMSYGFALILRHVNAALKRERYQGSVIDELLPDSAEAYAFTKVDFASTFWCWAMSLVCWRLLPLLTRDTTAFVCRWSASSEILIPEAFTIKCCWASQVWSVLLMMCLFYGRDYVDHDGNIVSFMKRCQLKGVKPGCRPFGKNLLRNLRLWQWFLWVRPFEISFVSVYHQRVKNSFCVPQHTWATSDCKRFSLDHVTSWGLRRNRTFKHLKSSPHHSQGNGKAESTVKEGKKKFSESAEQVDRMHF